MSGIRLKHNGWVVIADGGKALFLVNAGTPAEPALQVVGGVEQKNPSTAQQGTSKPGRLSDGMGGSHRSAVQETDWHKLAKEEFARGIATMLEEHVQASRFEQLIVVAPPAVLGAMRKEFSDAVSGKIIAEINKDLTGHPVEKIEKLLFD